MLFTGFVVCDAIHWLCGIRVVNCDKCGMKYAFRFSEARGARGMWMMGAQARRAMCDSDGA